MVWLRLVSYSTYFAYLDTPLDYYPHDITNPSKIT